MILERIIYWNEVSLDGYSRKPAFVASALLHTALALFVILSPFPALMNYLGIKPEVQRPAKVFELHHLNLTQSLPLILPPGPGGHPGKGTEAKRPPRRGAKVFNSRITVVSNPPHPDNSEQTILQPKSPPKLQIPHHVPLPNMVLGMTPPVPAPPQKPPPNPQVTAPHVPKVPTVAVNTPPVPPPDLILPYTPSPKGIAPLPAAPPPPPSKSPKTNQQPTATGPAEFQPQGRPGTNLRELFALSLNPAPPGKIVALPEGNRLGAFSMSAFGGEMGSPGGVPGGAPNGGVGGPGNGGDLSSGVGHGNAGGGGGEGQFGANAIVSITGPGASRSGVGGVLAPPPPASLVYPVVSPPKPRWKAMVITSGPTGGGGLRVFGVLHGGKIYTVYLPMPGNSWILQYCSVSKPATNNDDPNPQQGVVLHLDFGLVPPSPEKQFNFHHPWPIDDSAGHMIILRGIIRKDGTVSNLKVMQGVQERADEAALAAFSRWKFKPAMRDKKPIDVEILVGIPINSAEQ